MARPQGDFSMMEMMVALAVIAISSFAMSSDDQKAKEAGATAYLANPTARAISLP